MTLSSFVFILLPSILTVFPPNITHELGHAITMIFLSINDKDFNGCILPSFHGICGFSSYTNSEYTDFIAKDTVKYSRQIKLISISGIVFQISLCLVFIFVNSISYIASRHSVFLLFIFILCFSIILHLFMFFNRRNTNSHLLVPLLLSL